MLDIQRYVNLGLSLGSGSVLYDVFNVYKAFMENCLWLLDEKRVMPVSRHNSFSLSLFYGFYR